jgi:trehalose 6-phosphate synthase
MSSGGLVSALQGLSKSMEFQWFGWPGTEIHRNDREMVRQELSTRFNAVPIFLPKETAERHYNGFSSKSVPSTLGVPCGLADELRFCPLATAARHAKQSRV